MSTWQQMRRKTRLKMEAILPKPVMSLIGFLYPPSLFVPRLKQNLRENEYRKATTNLDPTMVLFPGNHSVQVTPEARASYEHFCWRDERMVVEMTGFLKLAEDKRCLYDIGALHGVFSFAFAKATGGRSFAFEPSPEAAKVLRAVGDLNPALQVKHFPFALGEHQGRLRMKTEWQHFVAIKEGDATDNVTEVDVMSLDEFVASGNPAPDCLKIDVEGYELEVLRGAMGALREYRPLIFLELHPRQLQLNGTSVAEVLALLAEVRYEVLGTNLRPFRTNLIDTNSPNAVNAICRAKS